LKKLAKLLTTRGTTKPQGGARQNRPVRLRERMGSATFGGEGRMIQPGPTPEKELHNIERAPPRSQMTAENPFTGLKIADCLRGKKIGSASKTRKQV